MREYLDTTIVIAVNNNTEIKKYLSELGCRAVKTFNGQKLVDFDGSIFRNYEKTPATYWSESHELLAFDNPYACTSQLCNQSFFDTPFFHYWAKKFMPNWRDHAEATNQFTEKGKNEPVIYHRKLWEWVYITQALYERNLLQRGKKGVVFGVGEKCTPDLFASFGCEILATDLGASDAVAQGWMESEQNVGGDIKKLNQYHFCSSEEFDARVSYRDVDMNNIPDDIKDYDFCWSSCALEHLGSLQKGLDFIKNSLKTIKSGGVAVHTTEYNLASDTDTLESEGLSIYRRQDIEKIIEVLRAEGHYVYPMDWHLGDSVVDKFIDLPPFSKKDMHLRLAYSLGEYPCTSIGLIIQKA